MFNDHYKFAEARLNAAGVVRSDMSFVFATNMGEVRGSSRIEMNSIARTMQGQVSYDFAGRRVDLQLRSLPNNRFVRPTGARRWFGDSVTMSAGSTPTFGVPGIAYEGDVAYGGEFVSDEFLTTMRSRGKLSTLSVPGLMAVFETLSFPEELAVAVTIGVDELQRLRKVSLETTLSVEPVMMEDPREVIRAELIAEGRSDVDDVLNDPNRYAEEVAYFRRAREEGIFRIEGTCSADMTFEALDRDVYVEAPRPSDVIYVQDALTAGMKAAMGPDFGMSL